MASRKASHGNQLSVSQEERLNALADELIEDCRNPEELLESDGSLKQMARELAECMLGIRAYRQA